MRRKVLAVIGAVISLLLIGCSETNNINSGNANANVANTNRGASTSPVRSTSLGESDRNFLKEAAEGGMAEVELGRLAAQKGQNAEVKRFGERMVTDHSKANNELKQLASQKAVTVPTELGNTTKQEIDRLSKLSGAAFDREYMKLMVEDHDKDVKGFQEQASSAADPDVKSFAAKVLPVITEHQKMAHEIAGKLK